MLIFKKAITGGPRHPFHMVFSLKNSSAIKSILSYRSVTLLSNKFLENLVEFNQKLGHFEQFIQRMIAFSTSDPINATKALAYYDKKVEALRLEDSREEQVSEKMWEFMERLEWDLKDKKGLVSEEIYLIGFMRQLKAVHVEGIGDYENPGSLRWSFEEVKELLQLENLLLNTGKEFKMPVWEETLYILGIATLLIPIFYFLFNFCVILVKIN